MPESEPLKPDENSKSKRKREMLALQKMGEALLKLSPDQLNKIELPENLLAAILQAKSLSSHEAKRRQLQYIGKLMRDLDPDAIKLALKRIQLIHEKSTTAFHLIESWRTKLIDGGDDALNSFMLEYPSCDRQQLRQLIRKAQQDRKNDKNTGAEKSLFKLLESILGLN